MNIDDKELEKIFLKINQNRTSGIEELYSKYNKVVYSIAFTITKNKTDSEDIKQTVFTKIYEMDKSKLPITKQSSWLYSITKNETINFIKKNKKDTSLDKIYEISDDNNELNKIIDNIEFNRLINKLNEKEKEIVSLRILSNFTFEEIGKLLNEPVGTVKWRYYKAIYSLKAILGNFGMFIISFILGVKLLVSGKQNDIKKESPTIQDDTKNSTSSEKDIIQNENKSFNSDSTKEQNFRDDATNNIIINITQDYNNSVQENITYIDQPENSYSQYIGYSFIGISILFLVITLTFLIKNQLKLLKKLSK